MSRGRGRGSQLSFNAELLGVGRGNAPQSVLTPPPLYPPRTNKASPLLSGPEQDYLLAVRKEFLHQIKLSPFHIPGQLAKTSAAAAANAAAATPSCPVERYSDRYDSAASNSASNSSSQSQSQLDIDWSRLPRELRPEFRNPGKSKQQRKRKFAPSLAGPAKSAKSADVAQTLEELEKREKAEEGKEDKDKDEEEDDEDKEKADKDEEEEEIVEDEELDEGTDYANNYFDNGESYMDDEEDNLDEGGIF